MKQARLWMWTDINGRGKFGTCPLERAKLTLEKNVNESLFKEKTKQ